MIKNLSTKKDYQKVFKIIKSVINSWDPFSLLASGAPTDEYEVEISMLMTKLKHFDSPIKASEDIANIFSIQFDSDAFTKDSCKEVGEQLFEQLIRAEIISKF